MAKKTRAERKKQSSRSTESELYIGSNDVDAEGEDVLDIVASDIEKDNPATVGDSQNSKSEDMGVQGLSDARAERLRQQIEKQNKKRTQTERKAPGKAVSKDSKLPKPLKTFINYCSNVKAEMKRVVWPTKQETLRMSLVVLFALIFFGVFVFLIDSGAVPALDKVPAIEWYNDTGDSGASPTDTTGVPAQDTADSSVPQDESSKTGG